MGREGDSTRQEAQEEEEEGKEKVETLHEERTTKKNFSFFTKKNLKTPVSFHLKTGLELQDGIGRDLVVVPPYNIVLLLLLHPLQHT